MNNCFKRFLFGAFLLFDTKYAFAGDENAIYLTVQVGVFALILVVGALVYLIRREVSQNRIFNLQAIVYKPLYYRNMVTGEEHISYSLKNFLGISDNENVISAIANRLIFEDRQKFSDLYSQLIEISNSHDDVDICESNQVIRLELEDGFSPIGVQFLSCQHLILRDHAGVAYGFFLFFGDVTSYVNQYDKLDKENVVLQAEIATKNRLINLLPCPVWMRDKDLNIVYFNNEFKRMVSYKQSESSSNFLEIDNQSKSLAKKAEETVSVQFEERYTVVDGQRCLYQFFETPIANAGMMAGMAYDITSKDVMKSELDRHIAVQFNLLESTASATAIYGSD